MVTVAVIAPGAMGSAVAGRLIQSGCSVLTILEGRSDETRKRAKEVGMVDASITAIAEQADLVLSIIPPRDAYSFAKKFADALATVSRFNKEVVFADCNAVNPNTVKKIATLFDNISAGFVDGCIIGGPPTSDGYNPTFYISGDHQAGLDSFGGLEKYGLKIKVLSGEGVGTGDASALKMSYAGISKGITGLFTTMILAAHSSSSATSEALLHELRASQPALLERITRTVPPMLPKAYRWVGEMQEIAAFVGNGEGEIYEGIAKTYERIERGLQDDSNGDVKALKDFVNLARKQL
ncbi:6-phosphogluconate dehydrogenase C-terminal domain-like protein [Crucibulum laeve]|uniref:6-phosphogluconate dehydrogenase C-terminal domain-like protein n=1 Tax=Crucibulum laeve TaxID=68775 RepID=A0A5C3MIJ8_9AGAR|nr:6-phosphogluconate dehydrogenase C-terminal domain-like protein [Crucibulum laeve]